MADADELEDDAERERDLSEQHSDNEDLLRRQAEEQREAETRTDEAHES